MKIGDITYQSGEHVEYFIYPSEYCVIYAREIISKEAYRWMVVQDIESLRISLSPFSYPDIRNRLNFYMKHRFIKSDIDDYSDPNFKEVCLKNADKEKSKFSHRKNMGNM